MAASRDIVPVTLGEFATSTVGRYWETDTFDNAGFDPSGAITNVSANVNRIPGWEIHNIRVELGQGTTAAPQQLGVILRQLIAVRRHTIMSLEIMLLQQRQAVWVMLGTLDLRWKMRAEAIQFWSYIC